MFKKLDDNIPLKIDPKNPYGRNEYSLDPKKESPGAWINPQSYQRYDKNIKVLCSGGANTGVVKHNGFVYKCFHDLNPIGDMTDLNCLSKEAKLCKVGHICDDSGCRMKSTRYFQNEEEKEKYMGYKNNPVATRWHESSDPSKLKMQYGCFDICPTYACNYNCYFCCNAYKIGYEPREVLKNERPKEDWFKFFNNLKNKFNKCSIVYIGGEPLAYYAIEELIEKSADYNFNCSIVTNFSITRKLDKILNINFKDPSSFKLSISLHPVNPQFNFDKVVDYILKFKERGHPVRTIIVSAPEQIDHYKKFKPILNSIGIDCWCKGMGGYDSHPGYNSELKKFIYDEGGYESTASYLYSINWEQKDWD
jgi:organic radical activating enzyme